MASCGAHHMAVVTECGNGSSHLDRILTLCAFCTLDGVVCACTLGRALCACTTERSRSCMPVWAWGSNSDGQCGTAGTCSRSACVASHQFSTREAQQRHAVEHTPRRVCFGGAPMSLDASHDPDLVAAARLITAGQRHDRGEEKMAMVSCGGGHSAAVSDSGKLWAWGDDEYGQLGLISQGLRDSVSLEEFAALEYFGLHPRETPTLVAHFSDMPVLMVACGWEHTCAVTREGAAFSWGNAADGRLGHGDVLDTRPDTKSSVCRTPKRILALEHVCIVLVGCGDKHSVAVSACGSLFSWGSGKHGQLGHPPPEDTQGELFEDLSRDLDLPLQVKPEYFGADGSSGTVVFAACGDAFTGAITGHGLLYMWGCNSCGQLGLGHCVSCLSPREISPALFDDDKVVSVALGQSHAAAVSLSQRLYVWGGNGWGQLGLGDEDDRHTPVSIDVDALQGEAIIQVIFHQSDPRALASRGPP